MPPSLKMLDVDKQSCQPAVLSCSNKMSLEGTQKNTIIMNFNVDSKNTSKQKQSECTVDKKLKKKQ